MKALSFFLAAFLLSTAAQAGLTGSYYKGALVTHLEGSTFTTKENFSGAGTAYTLPSGRSFTEYRGRFFTSYDFTDWWNAYIDFTFKRNRASSEVIELINTGFGEVGLGGSMLAWSGFFRIVPDLYISLPTYPANGGDGGVLLGDGVLSVEAKAYLTKKFNALTVALHGGIKLRTGGLATQVPLGLQGIWDLRSFYVHGGLQSLISLGDDSAGTNTYSRTAVNERLAAGSFIYNGINSSVTWASLNGGFRISPQFFINAGVDTNLMGTNAAKGTRFLIGVTFAEMLSENNDQLHRFVVETEPDLSDEAAKPTPSQIKRPRKKRFFGPF